MSHRRLGQRKGLYHVFRGIDIDVKPQIGADPTWMVGQTEEVLTRRKERHTQKSGGPNRGQRAQKSGYPSGGWVKEKYYITFFVKLILMLSLK